MYRKVVCLFLVVVVCLCGCGTKGLISEEREIRDTIQKASNSLISQSGYLISCAMEGGTGEGYSIDLKSGDRIYTEVPVVDGVVSAVPYGSSESIDYSLVEWTEPDGSTYLFSGEGMYSTPSGYSTYVLGKKDMYVSDMLKVAYSFKPEQSLTFSEFGSNTSLACYSFYVPADTVRNIIWHQDIGIYSAIQGEHTKDSIGKLCGYYLADTDRVTVCSDAKVYVGIDNQGVLRYCALEVGGLGTRLYSTKVVLELGRTDLDFEPDFSYATDFSLTLVDFADYVAGFDSYEDALYYLSSQSEEVSTE